MALLSLRDVVKQYGSYTASKHVSFEIKHGRIFGLLGPNGAGKTTLIRMITRKLHPDSGSILFNNLPLTDKHTEQIGYMPEERGLYKKMKVGDHLIYLGRLKGLNHLQAVENVKYWLVKFQIEDWFHKTIGELSKGMSQKVQFIATVLHNPDLLILDEPFSGLDPINSKLIEDEIKALGRKGKTVIFSTHRMEQVEEICDEIVLINKGEKILEGGVSELKHQFKQNRFRINYKGILNAEILKDLQVIEQLENELTVQFDSGHNSNELLEKFIDNKITVTAFNELLPSINEIFIRQVQA